MASPLKSDQDYRTAWHILQADQRKTGLLNKLSFEWDYCMIHDHAGAFTGSIGYVIAEPDLSQSTNLIDNISLLPKGFNLAIAGRLENDEKISQFINFSFDRVRFNQYPEHLGVEAVNGDIKAAIMTEHDGSLVISGLTHEIEYHFKIIRDWSFLQSCGVNKDQPFTPVVGNDIGFLPHENWAVDALWPRTKVLGHINHRLSNQTLKIDGHGYREKAFGQWLFFLGGWEFAAMSDEKSEVAWIWQTYHHSQDLSFLDVSFPIENRREFIRFRMRNHQLDWHHDQWGFDSKANQKYPSHTSVFAQNDDFVVEAKLITENNYAALLYEKSWKTKFYVIFALFPLLEGVIRRTSDGSKVLDFCGLGGGEYSSLRLPVPN